MHRPPASAEKVAGLLLAAGAGRRMGGPKALLSSPRGGRLLDRALQALREGGCGDLTVVLGAGAGPARELLAETGWTQDPALRVVEATGWREGMGASLRAGLTGLTPGSAEAVLVTLVDLPDVGGPVVRRVLATGSGAAALVRAEYDGRPGHPVLIGRDHWPGVVA
ncbi:MAG: NTP transferase domain-containing protein, partial [Nocardioidaceae bacterium]